MVKMQIKHIDDEQIVVLVDGSEVGYANHDEDGWNGMGKIENIVEAMAHALGANFEHIYE